MTAGIDRRDDVDPAAATLELGDEHRPIDYAERMLEETDDRLHQNEPTRLGAAHEGLEMVAKPDAEHDEEGRIVDRIGGHAVVTVAEELRVERADEANADRADQPGMVEAVHEDPQRLGHVSRELLRGEGARVAAIHLLVVDADVDGLAVLFHHRKLVGGALRQARGDRRKPFREEGAPCRDLVLSHAATPAQSACSA